MLGHLGLMSRNVGALPAPQAGSLSPRQDALAVALLHISCSFILSGMLVGKIGFSRRHLFDFFRELQQRLAQFRRLVYDKGAS